MQRKNAGWIAVLALTACAANGQGGTQELAGVGEGAAGASGTPDAMFGVAGMAAPELPQNAVDPLTDTEGVMPPDPMTAPEGGLVGNPPMTDESGGDVPNAPPESADAASGVSESTDVSSASSPASATPPPVEFTSLADLEPAADNIPECPATAPEDPWGPCVGVPVYAVCNYGTEPAPFYTCVCDWIHWICVGVQ